MTKLVWDQVKERFYESGIDRGVLYLQDGSGIPWNGLTSVEQATGFGNNEPLYFDGVHYADHSQPEGFTAAIKAYTYPDEFLQYQGMIFDASENGLNLNGITLSNQQTPGRFGLSYRSFIGNDEDGLGYGYKIHICYNLSAQPATNTFKTTTSNVEPFEFSWVVRGMAEKIPGAHPTAYLEIDSRKVNKRLLADIEDILYGTFTTEPRLPNMAELLSFVGSWRLSDWWLSKHIVAFDENRTSYGLNSALNVGKLGSQGNIAWTNAEVLPKFDSPSVYFPAVTGEYIRAQHPGNIGGFTKLEYRLRVAFSQLGVTNTLCGTESTHTSFYLDSSNRLGIYSLNTSLAYIGNALSSSLTGFIPLNTPIWLRGVLTVATAECKYYISYDEVENEEDVVWSEIAPLTSSIGSNANTTPVLTSSSVSTYGANSNGLSSFKGFIFAGSTRFSDVVRHKWTKANLLSASQTSIPCEIGPSLSIFRTSLQNQHIEILGTKGQARILNGATSFGEISPDPLGAYVDLNGVDNYISTPDSPSLRVRGVTNQTFLELPGVNSNSASIPNSAALTPTNGIDIMWCGSLLTFTGIFQYLVNKNGFTANGGYNFRVSSTGVLQLLYSDGQQRTFTSATLSSQGLTPGVKYWLRATLELVGGQAVCKFYRAAYSYNEPTTWTEFTSQPAAQSIPITINASVNPLILGTTSSGSADGSVQTVHRAIVKDGVAGTTIADILFDGKEGLTSFTANVGGTVTINGSDAKITDGLSFGFSAGNNSSMFSIPYDALMNITGSLDIRARLCADWTNTSGAIVARDSNPYLFYYSNNRLYYIDAIYPSGVSSVDLPSFVNGQTYWVRVQHNTTTGVVSFAFAADQTLEPTSWTTIATSNTYTPTPGSRTITTTSVLQIGRHGTSTWPLAGRIYRVLVKSGIDGTNVVDVDFTKQLVNATTFRDQSPNKFVVSVSGQSRIERLRDLDIIARIRPKFWRPETTSAILSKWSTGSNQRSFMFRLVTTGTLDLSLSPDGATSLSIASTTAMSDLLSESFRWVRVTFESATRDVKFYTANDQDSEPTSWTQLGTTVKQAAYSFFQSVANLDIGGLNSGTIQTYSGKIKSAILKNGVAGSVLASFYANGLAVNGTKYVDQQKNQWTLMSGASLFNANPLNFRPDQSFTIWAIVSQCTSAPSNYARLISKRSLITDRLSGYELTQYGTTKQLNGFIGDGVDTSTGLTNAVITNTPKIVAMVVDRQLNKLLLYVDSEVVETTPINIIDDISNELSLRFGKAQLVSGGENNILEYGFGVIDEALDASELIEIKEAVLV